MQGLTSNIERLENFEEKELREVENKEHTARRELENFRRSKPLKRDYFERD